MPDVVCEKCSTQYTLATRLGQGLFGGGLHAQLIEKTVQQQTVVPAPYPPMQQLAASGRFCFKCGSSIQQASKFCSGCGTAV